ncbi:MAG TPA: acyl carrier protein [Candidatus Sulfopaludibacter sp.]|nr:acyl carrier protein [Candidatus Sulfopaludibacter sp.]
MEKELIIDKLTTIFRDVFSDNTIILKEEITANDIGSWNSLSHMLMIAEVENNFSIKFKLKEISKLKDVGTLIDLVDSKLS